MEDKDIFAGTDSKTSTLNEGQRDAFDNLKKFVDNPQDKSIFLLSGYGGTGKTYLVDKLLEYVNSKKPYWEIGVTAPTNKAVRVLKRMSSFKRNHVTYSTIHKLLGLTEEIKPDGKIEFTKKKFDVNSIEDYNIVIVDEVSMLDDSLFNELNTYRNAVKLILMGDPAQIPPVNKPDCIPFREELKEQYHIKECRLTEIVRQAKDNPIIYASFQLRNNLLKNRPIEEVATTIDAKGHGVIRINPGLPGEMATFEKLLMEYFNCEAFNADPDHAKVIAWTNKAVDTMNAIIRKMLHGPDCGSIVVGEKLIANAPIMEGPLTILFNNSEEFEVEEFEVVDGVFSVDKEKIKLSYYDTYVTYVDEDELERSRQIKILHENSELDFSKALDTLKKVAIESKGANRSWIKFYEFKRMFADVNYNLCLTAHKAQGSTYKNVFLLEDNIDRNQDLRERNRIKYTAYSRPTDRLFIVKK